MQAKAPTPRIITFVYRAKHLCVIANRDGRLESSCPEACLDIVLCHEHEVGLVPGDALERRMSEHFGDLRTLLLAARDFDA